MSDGDAYCVIHGTGRRIPTDLIGTPGTGAAPLTGVARAGRQAVARVWRVADELKIPPPEDEALLWSLIEAAWAPLGPGVRQARQELVVRPTWS